MQHEAKFHCFTHIMLQGVLQSGGPYFQYVIVASHTFVRRKIIGMQLHPEQQPEVHPCHLYTFPNKFCCTKSHLEY